MRQDRRDSWLPDVLHAQQDHGHVVLLDGGGGERVDVPQDPLAELVAAEVGVLADQVRQPIIALTSDLKVIRVNDAFAGTFQITPEEAEDKSIYELGGGKWDVPRLRQLLEEVLPSQGEVRDFRLEHDFPTVGRRKLMINGRRFCEEGRGLQLVVLALEDITNKK